jgi:alpha/beta superfamily hydrolase
LPGNEKNLDLAQAVRRAGWNAVTFNYRGSWGSPGAFRFAQNLQDADAVLAYLRNPANALKLGIDPTRIAIAGHSMGGWVVAHTAAHDHALIGAILISMTDMGLIGSKPHAQAVASMAEDMETLSGVTAESMVNELKAHAREFLVAGTAQGLARIPVLALTVNDHLAAQTDALVAAIKAKGGTRVTAMHVDTDHGWSDHRIALESTVITWLAGLN